MKVGFVSIVGRPNAGKSTLLNTIIGSKVAIVSDKAHTTRNNIQGIYNDEDAQIIFIDTPGVHKPVQKLGKYMNKQVYYSLDDADVILFMVDVTEKIGKGDKFILEKLKEEKKTVFLILNKVDKIQKEFLFPMIEEYNKLFDFKEIIPISALKNDNISDLVNTIKKYLNEGDKYYPEEYYTDKSINFMVSEIVREKVLKLTNEEVPHAVTCVVEKFEDNGTSIHINVLIIASREGIKKILVGHNGSMIKQIGTDARSEIEKLVGKKVYLELFVKVINNWRDKEKYLIEFGFKEENEN
ncbi:MAG: GTPase Era [Bacilli bacterium]|nr:GTPase Era [Bacilli bacterium]